MSGNRFQIRHRAPAALIAVLVAAHASGCGDNVSPAAPAGPDLTTIQGAIFALEDYYSRRNAPEAIALLADDYTFTPALPESIPFLAPGETSWSHDTEVAILSNMLVPERTNWLDQVLLDVKPQIITPNADSSQVDVDAIVELEFLVGVTLLEQARSNMVMSYRRDAGGDYRLFREVESLSINPDTGKPFKDFTVGELRAQALANVQP